MLPPWPVARMPTDPLPSVVMLPGADCVGSGIGRKRKLSGDGLDTAGIAAGGVNRAGRGVDGQCGVGPASKAGHADTRVVDAGSGDGSGAAGAAERRANSPVTVPAVLSTVTVPPELWANTPPDVTSCVVTLTAPVPCATALIPAAPETVPFAVTVRAPLPLRISALIAVLVAVTDPVVILIGPLMLWAEMPVPLDVIELPSPLICSVLVAFGILTALPKAGWMVTPGATFSVCVFAPLRLTPTKPVTAVPACRLTVRSLLL
jgi:hypothetical protein